MLEEIHGKIENNSSISKEATLENLEVQRKVLEACVKEINQKVVRLSQKAEELKGLLMEDIKKDIDEGFSLKVPLMVDNPKPKELNKLSSDMQKRLNEMLQNNIIPREIKEDIISAIHKIDEINDIGFLKNYKAVTVSELVRKYDKYINDYVEGKDIYDNLIIRYTALCEMTGVAAKQYTFSRESICELETQIGQMEKELVRQAEQTYISDCIDEVMAEMGYEVLGERLVTKRSGKRFRNELYSFKEGTAVNVTYASDGNITMELGGLDKIDRLPSDDEINRLCEDMEVFCDEFLEVEERLGRKGVIVGERISLLPPLREYAQVINVADYSIKTEGDIEIIHVKKRDGRIKRKQDYMG
jgi:hypothetical protein